MDRILENKAQERARLWLGEGFDPQTREEVKALLALSERPGEERKELVDAFYKDIDFGTGGVRGLMGVGSNRINRYTLSRVTRGLINFAAKHFPSETLKSVIAYDTRNHSQEFARQTAEIFSASGAQVFLFRESMPTPLLSYAVRQLGCRIGIVITASHNPKEYNGYKVYFNDGGQIVPPWDKWIIDEVRKIEGFETTPKDPGKIVEIRDEVVTPYREEVMGLIESLIREGDYSLPLVFSSIHGTGGKMVIPLLETLGFTRIHRVAAQMKEDGNFPTVVYPNPEEREALTLGIELMEETQSSLLMATDPDADRLGVAIRDHGGRPLILNGNQIGILLADFVLSSWSAVGMPPHPFLVRTIVTTPLIDPIAEEHGLEVFRVLTGFKYIGEVIRKYEQEKRFLFGLEESHGYLAFDAVRDKDAVSSALIFAVMAAHYQGKGMSIYQRLCEIYEKYGFYYEHLASLTKTGPEGVKEIENMIMKLRDEFGSGTRKAVAGDTVDFFRDYGRGYEINLQTQERSPIDLPPSEVIQLQTRAGSSITIRPSGTEPKIKFYFSVRLPLSGQGDIFSQVDEARKEAEKKIAQLQEEIYS